MRGEMVCVNLWWYSYLIEFKPFLLLCLWRVFNFTTHYCPFIWPCIWAFVSPRWYEFMPKNYQNSSISCISHIIDFFLKSHLSGWPVVWMHRSGVKVVFWCWRLTKRIICSWLMMCMYFVQVCTCLNMFFDLAWGDAMCNFFSFCADRKFCSHVTTLTSPECEWRV